MSTKWAFARDSGAPYRFTSFGLKSMAMISRNTDLKLFHWRLVLIEKKEFPVEGSVFKPLASWHNGKKMLRPKSLNETTAIREQIEIQAVLISEKSRLLDYQSHLIGVKARRSRRAMCLTMILYHLCEKGLGFINVVLC